MYFDNVKTIGGLKRSYRALAKKHHSDLHGGNDAVMKDINVEFNAKIAEFERAELLKQQQAANDNISRKQYERDRAMYEQQPYAPPSQDDVSTALNAQSPQPKAHSIMQGIGAKFGEFMRGISVNFEMPKDGGFRVEVKK